MILSGPLPIPKRTSSKRARKDLQNDYKHLQLDLELAKREVRPSTSFDARYWTSAAAACEASVECLHAETKLAVRDWVENGEGPAASWWATNEARRIIEQIKAATLEKSLYIKQAPKAIIDEDTESLDKIIVLKSQGIPKDITIRDLDDQRLSFRNDNRPRVRYLYFPFVVAQLKMAWRHEYQKDPTKKLRPQLGKEFWVSRGRYLNWGLLLALAEEIGHDTSFPENMPPLPGTDHDTQPQRDEDDVETGLIVIAKIIAAQRRGDEEEDEEEE
ncbi:hypothetical protein B0H67DRAFT_648348 [Lasiosphaeris hirsuta]|uniref:Uncharacterized protein n=1 Tax=Lasiosphaeris hirsuta TaxID=260670 RepID=A0AA40A2U5_9PEZI|nr:hypothetical protein B0H67DRAFT_648348 [Lasiosphaeris hirsuta]